MLALRAPRFPSARAKRRLHDLVCQARIRHPQNMKHTSYLRLVPRMSLEMALSGEWGPDCYLVTVSMVPRDEIFQVYPFDKHWGSWVLTESNLSDELQQALALILYQSSGKVIVNGKSGHSYIGQMSE
jgi:hypothetical protein